MSDAYVGEIRMFGGDYAPQDWALCDGRALKISDYQTLYSLIGLTYGGDGVTNFNLPDLRGRIPINNGQGTGLTNRTLGRNFGSEQIALTVNNIPAHTHSVIVGGPATSADPSPAGSPAVAKYLGNTSGFNLYSSLPSDGSMSSSEIGNAGGRGTAHDNMMPSLSINYIISLNGIYPTHA